MDSKTKYFLDKIDYLISKGIVKNHQQVVNELDWNKSVMSSVRKGAMPVPQHIYNKFKQYYENDLVDIENPDTTGQDLQKELIESLKRENVLLRQQLDFLKDKVLTSLSEIDDNQFLNSSILTGWLELIVERAPLKPKEPLHEVRERIRNASISYAKAFEGKGKPIVSHEGN